MTLVTFTIIRHGESTDNLRQVWAGWADAPLSNHGINQANALGASLSSIRFEAIHASDLLRAHTTALCFASHQVPPFSNVAVSPLFREQHWGEAEHQPWTPPSISRNKATKGTKHELTKEELYKKGIYPILYGRTEKFPGGESADDLRARAEEALNTLLLPQVWDAAKQGKQGVHIAVVSHGLFISELVAALLEKYDERRGKGKNYRGLHNTAWVRVKVDVKGMTEGEPLQLSPDMPLPPLTVQVTDFNRHEHTDKLTRQKGGIGSAAHDPNQKSLRDFFGGVAPSEPSNAAEDVVKL